MKRERPMRRVRIRSVGLIVLPLVAPALGLGADPAWAEKKASPIAQIEQRIVATKQQLEELFDGIEPLPLATVNSAAAEARAKAELAVGAGDKARAKKLLEDVIKAGDYAPSQDGGYLLWLYGEVCAQRDRACDSAAHERRILLGGSADLRLLAARKLMRRANGDDAITKLRSDIDKAAGAVIDGEAFRYRIAKAFYFEGHDDAAWAYAKGISAKSPWFLRAWYLQGVVQVRRGDLAAALTIFREVMQAKGADKTSVAVRELATMNAGRILAEQNKTSEAVDVYQRIPRTSPRFEETLYEVAWTYVRAAPLKEDPAAVRREWLKARDALEIFLLSKNSKTFRADARLLLANLLLQLQRFDQSAATFKAIADDYAPIRDSVLYRLKSQDAYGMVARDLAENKSTLPEEAMDWAMQHSHLRTARRSVEILEQHAERRQMLPGLLDAVMASVADDHLRMLPPQIRQPRVRLAALARTVTEIHSDLHAFIQQALPKAVSPQTGAALVALHKKKRALRAELEKYSEQPTAKTPTADGQFHGILWSIAQAHNDTAKIESLLSALSKAPRDTAATGGHAVFDEWEPLELELAAGPWPTIERLNTMLAEAVAAQKHESTYWRLLEQLDGVLQKENAILTALKPKKRSRTFEKLTRLEKQFAALEPLLRRITERLEKAEAAAGGDLFNKLSRLRRDDETHGEQIAKRHARMRELAGELVRRALEQTAAALHEVVLRGELGTVDVMWVRKETSSEKLSQTLQSQRHELHLLENDFRELLREE